MIYNLLGKQKEAGVAVIYVGEDLDVLTELCDRILVICAGRVSGIVEGAKASGAMITVNLALEQGREVFAVPGSIYSPLSEAPNQMILDGAVPVLSPWDILEHLGWARRPGESSGKAAPKPDLSPEEEAIVAPLRNEVLSFEELAQITGLSAAKLNSHLTMLELRGIIDRAPGGLYRAYV
jgi:DNA processing protein